MTLCFLWNALRLKSDDSMSKKKTSFHLNDCNRVDNCDMEKDVDSHPVDKSSELPNVNERLCEYSYLVVLNVCA